MDPIHYYSSCKVPFISKPNLHSIENKNVFTLSKRAGIPTNNLKSIQGVEILAKADAT